MLTKQQNGSVRGSFLYKFVVITYEEDFCVCVHLSDDEYGAS